MSDRHPQKDMAPPWLPVLVERRRLRAEAQARYRARGGLAALGVVLIVVAVLAAMAWFRV